MTDKPTPTAKTVLYEVSLLPEDHINYRAFTLSVGPLDGRWVVVHGDSCLGSDGTWANGVKPYGRGDDWFEAHRFDLDTALRLAKEAAPHVTVNGLTASAAYEQARSAPSIGRQGAEIIEFGDARLPDRFWKYVRQDDSGCWIWTQKPSTKGYGRYKIGEKRYTAHRFIYEAVVSPIAEGMQLDHVCHSLDRSCLGGTTCLHRRCVNPMHLEPVTNRENTLRRPELNKTMHCPQGHAYDVANTGRDLNGARYCRTCVRLATRQRRAAARAAQLTP